MFQGLSKAEYTANVHDQESHIQPTDCIVTRLVVEPKMHSPTCTVM